MSKNLPTVKELVKDLDEYKKKDGWLFLLNQEPPAKWVKVHPYAKDHKYIPIDKVEYLLRRLFKDYKIEILREGVSFNGVYVVARVHYKDPITNEMKFHDGIGAMHLQVKSGSSPADLQNINNGALSMAYPIAKTLAIKDACDHFGKLFGSDLNRKDALPAQLDTSILDDSDKKDKIQALLDTEGIMITEEDRLNFQRILDQNETASYDKSIKLLTSKLPK